MAQGDADGVGAAGRPTSIQQGLDGALAKLARWDRTRFIDDVFARPSVGPTAAWLIGALLALVTAIAIVYAPGAAARAGDVDCTVSPDGCISVAWGYRAILLVAALTFLAVAQRIRRACPRDARQAQLTCGESRQDC